MNSEHCRDFPWAWKCSASVTFQIEVKGCIFLHAN